MPRDGRTCETIAAGDFARLEGLTGLRSLRKKIGTSREALYLPRAQKPHLNVAKKDYDDAKDKLKQELVSAPEVEKWTKQADDAIQRAIDATPRDKTQLAATLALSGASGYHSSPRNPRVFMDVQINRKPSTFACACRAALSERLAHEEIDLVD